MAYGVKRGELATNPAERATPPTVYQAQTVAPTAEDVQAMIAAAVADDPDIGAFIALAAVTGARRGELLGLRWSDVDWEAETLLIERSVAVVGGKWIVKGTKSHGVRVIALDEFGTEVLRRHLATAEDRARDLGTEVSPVTPVFTCDGVTPISPDTVTHYVKRIAKRAGVDCHLHSLRHFAATQMVAGGTDVRTVAGRLGHRDASVTLRVYSHALPQQDRLAATALGRALTAGAKS